MSFSKSRTQHIEFRGCGVVDLAMRRGKWLEIKEAKGGTSSYGTCRDINGKKRVTQCTPRYTAVIAHKMAHSTYKGRHPEVPCSKHTAPDGTCKDCKAAERTRRQDMGRLMQDAINKRLIRKIAVRGNYTKTCLREPEAMDSYQLDTQGNRQDIAV